MLKGAKTVVVTGTPCGVQPLSIIMEDLLISTLVVIINASPEIPPFGDVVLVGDAKAIAEAITNSESLDEAKARFSADANGNAK